MQNNKIWYAVRSIRRTIPVAVVLPMLLGIMLTGYITYQNIQLAVEDLSSQLRAEISASVSTGVDRFLRVPRQILATNTKAVAKGVVPPDDVLDTSAWRNHLLAQIESFQDAQFVAYRTTEGKMIQVSRISENEVWLTASTPDSEVHTQQTIDLASWTPQEETIAEFPEAAVAPFWYSRALQSPGEPVWTVDFENHEHTQRGITLSRVVMHSNQPAGVVAVHIAFDNLNKLIQRLESTSGATIYFLRNESNVTASDVMAASARDHVYDAERMALAWNHDDVDSLLDKSLPHLPPLGVGDAEGEVDETVNFSFLLDKEYVDVEVSPLSVSMDPAWYSVVVIPRSDFTGRIRSNTRSTALLVLAGFLLTTWLGMRMARRIVDPVLGLSNAAAKIRTQSFDPTEVLRIAKRTDEFGELARAFTDMAEVVAAREKDLEAMVEKRTEQVREQNRKIAQQNEENEQLLLNILPLPTARRLQQGEKEISDAYGCATVLFSDLAGFTALSSQMASTDLLVMLNKIFTEFDHLCLDYGVEKIKTMGDGYMAAAGLPDHRDDHAQAIIALAMAMQDSLAEFNEKNELTLELRIGINSGPVTAGVIGTHKFIYDLWGDTVNIASRMESTGQISRIQVSKTTQELASDTFLFDSRGEIPVKGKGKMQTFWVDSVLPGAHLPQRASEPRPSAYSATGTRGPSALVDETDSWGDILNSDVSMQSIRALLSKDLFGGSSKRAGAREPKKPDTQDYSGQDISWKELMQKDVNTTTLKILLKKDLLGDIRKKKRTTTAVDAAKALLGDPDTAEELPQPQDNGTEHTPEEMS